VSFGIVKIDDVAYEELFNLLVYYSIRDNFFKSNNIVDYYTYLIKDLKSSQLNNI